MTRKTKRVCVKQASLCVGRVTHCVQVCVQVCACVEPKNKKERGKKDDCESMERGDRRPFPMLDASWFLWACNMKWNVSCFFLFYWQCVSLIVACPSFASPSLDSFLSGTHTATPNGGCVVVMGTGSMAHTHAAARALFWKKRDTCVPCIPSFVVSLSLSLFGWWLRACEGTKQMAPTRAPRFINILKIKRGA
jgi:hypothetical protein